MKLIPEAVEDGYLRLVTPVAQWLAARQVDPNAITVTGTVFWVVGGVLYAIGEIRTAGWLLGLTALFDVIDGQVARLSGRTTVFGGFLDSTLDRVADGAVLGGLAFFYATSSLHGSEFMLAVCIFALVGTQLVPYARARAEIVGVNGKVGFLQRPERVVLLSAPQAFFGLALNGMVLASILLLLTVAAWLTVGYRIMAVYRATQNIMVIAPPRDDDAAVKLPPARRRSRGRKRHGEQAPW